MIETADFYDSLPCFQLFSFFFFDYLLKWRIRRISIAKSIDFNVISQCRFCQYFWAVTCVFYARRADRPFSLFRSSAQSFILYFNVPRKTKQEDFLQFIFFHSPHKHKPKPKDFLQLILLIFYFEYPLKTWGNPFFTTYRSLHKPKPKDFLQLI